MKSQPAGQMQTSTIDDLRLAMTELLGAERRLRFRDQQSTDLSNSQLRALFAVDKADAVPAGHLARTADLNPATVTAMLDNLEEKGIVERRRDARDRRVCMVSLTAKGREIVAARRARYLALWHDSFGDMTDEELAVGLRVIRGATTVFDRL